jgi:hypothetical protein
MSSRLRINPGRDGFKGGIKGSSLLLTLAVIENIFFTSPSQLPSFN